jgi:cysteinyl-tRNA synthetase
LEINRLRSAFVPPNLEHPILTEVLQYREAFLGKMDDDFNTGGAVSDLFEIARCLNRLIESDNLEDETKRKPESVTLLTTGIGILRELGAILGIFLKPPKLSGNGSDDSKKVVDGLMALMLKLRAEARAKKDFAMSDSIRDGLAAIGITVQDGKNGSTWELSK